MNSGSSSLKVTVNGKKYLITGIQKETSCKGLLCAIAKVTSLEESGPRKSTTKASENLLESFKGDRQLAGDLTSLNVFNSLGKDAKIIARETVTVRKELIIDNSGQVQNSTGAGKHNKNSKKQKKSGKETKSKEEKKEKKSKNKTKKNKEILTTTTTTFTSTETKAKHKTKHRSVDDSDIESYRRDRLKRMKQRRRVYDDSDIDIYKNLEDIVVDQNKKLRRLQKHSREVKRTAWMKELARNSQIYYIDDEPDEQTPITHPIEVEAEKCLFEKDDGNDSGLPSPEYDSSESQENQPIQLKDSLSLSNHNTRYQFTKDEIKQKMQSKENNEIDKQLIAKDILQNTSINARNLNKENCFDSTKECSCVSTNTLFNKETVEQKNGGSLGNTRDINDKGEITFDERAQHIANGLSDIKNEIDTLQIPSTKNMVSATKEDQLIQSTTVAGDNKSSSLLIKKENYKNAMIDKNKNILKDTEACEREVNKMVAFNEALFKGAATVNNVNGKSKIDKRKFKKSDISDPVLLSPGTLKKHQSVKKVQSVLGKQAADVLRKDVLKTASGDLSSGSETKIEITKEKEKYFNKKLKEIRSKSSGKKSSKTTGKDSKKDKNEPEYLPKMLSDNNKQNQKDDDRNKSPVINELKSLINGSSLEKASQLNDEVIRNDTSIKQSFDIGSIQLNVKSYNGDNNLSLLPKSKQTDLSENLSLSSNTSETVLTADEILNEILEYEKSIQDELDQIIQTDEEGKEKEEENPNKEIIINKTNTSLKVVDKHDNSEPKINSNQCKQTSKAFKEKASDNISNCEQISTVLPTCDEEVMSDVTDSLVINEEQVKFELIQRYFEERQALEEISEKLSEYNYVMSRLQEDIALYNLEACDDKTLNDLDLEEQNISQEIENVKSLLKSVADLTFYQRKEMFENIEIMDQIDLEVRTQKANYDNLRSGTWKNNSKLAPRSLIKNAKVKRRNSLLSAVDSSQGEDRNSSSFV